MTFSPTKIDVKRNFMVVLIVNALSRRFVMLVETGDGRLKAGLADVMCIFHLPPGTFHVAFLEEHPKPSQPIESLDFIRLKSNMHHRAGSPTLKGANLYLRELREVIDIADANVVGDEAVPMVIPVSIWILPNWTTGRFSLKKVLLGSMKGIGEVNV